MTRKSRTLSLSMAAAAFAFALMACANGNSADSLGRAAVAVQRQRSYRASYTALTRIEGAPRPVVAEGVLEFRFPDRSRLTSGDLEVITIGRQVWARVKGRWQRDEFASPPLDPDLYLAAVVQAEKMRGSQYAFRVSVSAYRSELQRRMGALPEELVDRLKTFAAEGEVLMGEDGLPKEMTIRVKDTVPGPRTQIIKATFRFLEFGQAYDIEPPEALSP